jgi:hypothetical protein
MGYHSQFIGFAVNIQGELAGVPQYMPFFPHCSSNRLMSIFEARKQLIQFLDPEYSGAGHLALTRYRVTEQSNSRSCTEIQLITL